MHDSSGRLSPEFAKPRHTPMARNSRVMYSTGGWNVEFHLPIVSIPIIESDVAIRAQSDEEFINVQSGDRNDGTG